jgi:hypothetical protein
LNPASRQQGKRGFGLAGLNGFADPELPLPQVGFDLYAFGLVFDTLLHINVTNNPSPSVHLFIRAFAERREGAVPVFVRGPVTLSRASLFLNGRVPDRSPRGMHARRDSRGSKAL